MCPQEPVYCAPPGRSRLGHRQPIKSPLSTGSSCGILGMGNFILFLILICLTVLDLGCSGSSREVYFHEAYRVLSPGLPACCCSEQIISGLCLHLTHTLKTDVNNGCHPGGRQGTKSPPLCFHPNRLGWRGKQCTEKMVRLRWKDQLSQSPVKRCPQDKGVTITLDLPLFF